MKSAHGEPGDIRCRACLVQRRSLRSLFRPQSVGSYTYAELLGIIADVKIQPNDGYSDKICLTCRSKAQEAYEFKILIEESYKALCSNDIDNPITSSNFNNVNKIKIEIDCCKLENTLCKDSKEDVKDINFDFKKGNDKVFYNNTMINTLIKIENEPMTAEGGTVEVPAMKDDVEAEENCYYDDLLDDRSDDDYLPPGAKITSTKKSSKKHIGKRKNKHKGMLSGYKPNNKSKEAIHIKKVKPIVLEDVSLMKTMAPPKPKKSRKVKVYERICPYCGIITKSLKPHLLTHMGERKFKCTECPKAYFVEAQLRSHAVIHTGIRNFVCNVCGAQFYKKHGLINHLACHKVVRDEVCSICNKGFKTKKGLKKHVIRHSSANKIIKCELCNMSFFEKDQLKHHMRIHTGERPYKCELCSQPYSYKTDYNRHCFKKHGVFMKKRNIRVMNEEVLRQEREAVMAELEIQRKANAVQSIIAPVQDASAQAVRGYKYMIDASQFKTLFNC